MSDPIPVTTRIITDDSGSSRSVNPAVKSPDEIQVNTCPTIARESGGSATSRHTASSDTTKDPAIAPHATAPAAALLTRRPKLAFTRKPRSGRSGISSSITKMRQPIFLCGLCALRVPTSWRSPFEEHERFRVQRFAVAKQADDDREADGGFGGRHGHHEKDEDLAVGGAERAAEGHEGQVHRVEHDLDRQQDGDQVAPHEHAGGADREQNRD